MKAALLRSMALVLAVLAGGCGDDGDGFSPTIETVAGSYTASTFTIEDETGTIDLLALDASVSATLNEDGTTTGQLFVPEGDEDGSDLEADLTGTWTLEGDTVTFSQTGDTFITDVPFAVSENRLTGERTFGEETVRLVLTKDD